MNSQYLDMAAILNRFLDRAAQNLTIEKLLIQLHLDPSNITFDAIFHRLVEIVLVNITIPNMCALIAAGFYAATFLMSLIHISEPTRRTPISYAVFCLKK